MRIIDWSSDVCSSDLAAGRLVEEVEFGQRLAPGVDGVLVGHLEGIEAAAQHEQKLVAQHVADRAQLALEAVALAQQARIGRSAERRAGKECVSTCRSRWSRTH